MRTLEVIPSVSPTFGGPSTVVLNLTRAIRSQGVDAEIATTNDNFIGTLDIPLSQRVEYEQVPIWFFPRFPVRMKEFLFSGSLSHWLWLNTRNYNLTIAHYLFSYAPSCLATIARLQNIPYGVRTIGQLTPWALAQSRFKKQIYTALIERRNLEHAAFVHCTSSEEATDVTRLGIKTPKVVLPLGVNPPQIISAAKLELHHRYHIPENIPVILFLSRLHPKKRPDLLIQVLGQLVAQKQPFHLILAGSGDTNYLDSLHQLIALYNIQEQTTFTGFVTGRDKDLLFQGSDLFVLPTYSENFGIVLAEAMVAGLPVITTSGAQISTEIVQAKAGLIVDSESQLQLAIIQLLQSPNLRQELGENGRQFALQKYSWPAIAKQFITVYEMILKKEKLPELYLPM